MEDKSHSSKQPEEKFKARQWLQVCYQRKQTDTGAPPPMTKSITGILSKGSQKELNAQYLLTTRPPPQTGIKQQVSFFSARMNTDI